jgi:nucleoside-diphosphate-sugar epimerase
MAHTILITGSSGFLGSALSVDLSRDNTLFGIDTRNLSKAFRVAAFNVRWDRLDISDFEIFLLFE